MRLSTRQFTSLIPAQTPAKLLLTLSMVVVSLLSGLAARAAETWITDKIISVGSEHDYKATDISMTSAPGGTFIASWGTKPLYANNWYAHSVQFQLDGQRMRQLFELGPTGAVSYRVNIRCAFSPDSTQMLYAWGAQDFADTILYQHSCWCTALDYMSGAQLFPPLQLDSGSFPYTILTSNQQVAFINDTTAVVFWTEESSGSKIHDRRVLQRVSTSGLSIGSMLDIYTSGVYPCDSTDSCTIVGDHPQMLVLPGHDQLLIAHEAVGYVGQSIENAYCVARTFSFELVEMSLTPDILMCESFPCPSFTGFEGVNQQVQIDVFPDGGFAAAVNVGYDWDIEFTNFPGGRAFDSLFYPTSAMVGVSDHSPRDIWFTAKVACSPQDEYVVVWPDYGENGTSLTDFWAQRFARTGEPVGVNQRLNGILDLGASNAGVFDLAYIDSHLVVIHYGSGSLLGEQGPGYDVYPLILQVMPWDKVGYYLAGDVDQSGSITSADIVGTVNYVFKSGAAPKPQSWAADVDGGCTVTSADIIYSVNYVFKAGPAPVSNCAPSIPYVPPTSSQARQPLDRR